MKLLRVYHLALALGCLAAPSVARADSQATLDAVLSNWSGPKGLDTIRHLANCTVKRFPSSAQAFVRVVGDETHFAKNQSALFNTKCLKSYLFKAGITSMSPYIYLPLLAENLLLKDYTIASMPELAQVPALDHPVLPSVEIESVHPRYRELFVLDKITHSLERTAECVARVHPQDVFRLAQSVPGSADESSRLSTLQASAANCGGMDLGVTFPSFVWRGALVKNLYRLVDAARPVTHSEVAPNA